MLDEMKRELSRLEFKQAQMYTKAEQASHEADVAREKAFAMGDGIAILRRLIKTAEEAQKDPAEATK